jgi:hypothetical protein
VRVGACLAKGEFAAEEVADAAPLQGEEERRKLQDVLERLEQGREKAVTLPATRLTSVQHTSGV